MVALPLVRGIDRARVEEAIRVAIACFYFWSRRGEIGLNGMRVGVLGRLK